MMKASFRFILATLAATATLVGCTKEITPNFENDKVNPEGSRIIVVSFGQQTKTTLDGFQPKFANKDSILISNGEALDTCEVKIDDKGATITTKLTGPLTAVYPYKAAKMSEGNQNEIDTVLVSTVQSGKFADANICMAKMTDEKDESLSFENKTALFKIIPGAGAGTKYVEVRAEGFVIANNIPTGSAITDSSTIHVNTTTADSVYVSILVPEGLTVGSLSFSDGTNVKTIKDERTSTAIAAGALYTVTNENWESPEADIPDGALKGVFSVSADKQVYFSQGNLVATINATGTPTDWKFATNQYDYIGGTVANTSIGNTSTSGTAGDVDLFGWSTSTNGGTSTTDNYGIKTSTSTSDYSGEFYDWGKAYCEENSITPDNTWRTLSTEEWQYLFSYDGSGSGGQNYDNDIRRGKYKYGVTVCGKANCVVLLPDGWKWEGDVGTEWQTEYPETQTNNEVTWQKMEDAGAVCLPAAGLRNGSYVDYVGDYGNYWSSTAIDSDYAYFVDFDSSIVYPDDIGDRLNGFSVRLVTNVSAAPTPTAPAYVEITAKYDGEDKPERTLKWYRQNLAITDSGNKPWKGDNTSGAVKVPGTNEDVVVGDYFQWAAYENYALPATDLDNGKTDKGLLIYTSFTNKYCVDGGDDDSFEFKTTEAGKAYQFNTSWSEDSTSVGISPYFDGSKGEYGEYTKYTGTDDAILASSDDVANIILGENWRMPTSAEFKAMKKATYWVWDSDDMGYYVYAPASGDEGGLNGKQSDGETSVSGTYTKSDALLFFPAAGSGYGTDLNAGDFGYYWSGSLGSSYTDYAYGLYFYYSVYVNLQGYYDRYSGLSVRPVSD